MYDAFPVVDILLTEWLVESVRMARSLDVGCGRAFSQHLQNGIAGDEMDQQKDQRHYQPDHWQRVQHAKGEVAEHPVIETLNH